MQEPLIPIYKNVSFETIDEFETWLNKTAKYEIELEDQGQDFVKLVLASNLEVIHAECGISAELYSGRFVVNGKPTVGDKIELYNPDTEERGFIRYKIENVKVLENDNNSK